MAILAYSEIERNSDGKIVTQYPWKALKYNQHLLVVKHGDGSMAVAAYLFENQEELDYANKRFPAEVVIIKGTEV